MQQARSQVFSLGGGGGGGFWRAKRPKQLRSEQAVAGVWGRSPQRGPGAEPLGGGKGGAAPPGKIFRNRVF